MNLTPKQYDEIRIVSEYLQFTDLDDLIRLTSEAKTVLKLQNEHEVYPEESFLGALVSAMEFQNTEIMTLRHQLRDLETDLKTIVTHIKIQQDSATQNAHEVASLCNRHGIWT